MSDGSRQVLTNALERVDRDHEPYANMIMTPDELCVEIRALKTVVKDQQRQISELIQALRRES